MLPRRTAPHPRSPFPVGADGRVSRLVRRGRARILGATVLPVGLVLAAPAGAQQATTCPAPVPWTLAEVDERFGITRQDAADAVRQAGMLWSSAIGNPLLFPESPDGVPIRFVFDERQERVLLRRDRERDLEQQARDVETRRTELRRQGDEIQRQREVLRILTQDFEGRQRDHVGLVESWNARGGAPRAELERLQRISEELDRERESLDQRTAALNAQIERVNRETERLNADVADLAAARERLAAEVQDFHDQPAAFRDSRRTLGPFILSRTRGIDVFRFEDQEDLVFVLARQLGYGLGLETSEVPGSIMSVDARSVLGGGPPALDPSDLAAVRALCERN